MGPAAPDKSLVTDVRLYDIKGRLEGKPVEPFGLEADPREQVDRLKVD